MKSLIPFVLIATAGCAQILGFSPASAKKQADIEKQYLAIPSPESEKKFHRWLTAEPHPAGSERNNELARQIADLWRQQGLEDVAIRQYDVLVSEPREVSLELVAPRHYKAGLREEAYDIDPDTKNPRVKSAYISLSASGDVTAPLVYAHSGNPEDYELLKERGIDVKGKVVLVRYSNPYSYRGFKALTAQRLGAAALIIYSDPQEDGYKQGKVFPDGPWGPASHIQRGAITYDFIVPGDPLTPGWASVPGAKHIPESEAVSLPKIMAVAISWKDAQPLLENIGGPEAPAGWQGGLPLKYRLGGADAKVHLHIDMNTRVAPNYVVEGRIRDADYPDEWVILGNHRDAWEFGGVDPSSGTASLLEMTRAFGQMLKKGVRPRRTLVFCSWDGEEVGLTGSTEWGEQFQDELRKNAIAYLNVDSSTSGPNFQVQAVASLSPMLVELSKALAAPGEPTLFDAWVKSTEKERADSTASTTPLASGRPEKPERVTEENLVDPRIGSGSDHTVFLNHIGMPTAGLTFDGPYGVYHSMYDDFFWMNHFGDPGYQYHTLMSKYWGAAGLRLANADALPLDFTSYGKTLRGFVEEVQHKPGAAEHLDLAALLKAVDEFTRAGTRVNAARNSALAAQHAIMDEANHGLMQVEGNWLNPAGIPGRPWFKHLLYAARYTYAHLELPGLTEAVESGSWDVAREQAALLTAAAQKNAALLNKVANELAAAPLQSSANTGAAK